MGSFCLLGREWFIVRQQLCFYFWNTPEKENCQNCHLLDRFEKESSGILYIVKSERSHIAVLVFIFTEALAWRQKKAGADMSILMTENLKKYYDMGEIQVKALDGISLSVEKGEFVAVVGTSGSGKSTLLHMLGGLDIPTSGTVVVDGKDISRMTKDELTIFRRRKIGFVFQNYNLLPVMNVYENIVLPIRLDGIKPDRDYVEEIIMMLGLKEKEYAMPGPDGSNYY